jgi:hypothetical protein
MQLNDEMKVERQMFLDSELRVIVSEDPPDGYCKSYMYYVEKNKLAEKATYGKNGNIEEFDPFVEILILSHGPISAEPDRASGFSFMVSLVSSDEINKKKWRQIRDVVRKHLSDFEQEKFNTGGKPFLPKMKDPREPRPKTDLEILILSDRPAVDESDPLLGFSFDEPDPLPDISSDEPGLPLNLSFMVSFVSSFELDIKQWREIHDVVQKHLRDFELEQLMLDGRLFFPRDDDLRRLERKTGDIGNRLMAAREMVKLYWDLLPQIRKNHKVRSFLERLAAEYEMPIKEARSIIYPTYGGKARPAELAKELVVRTKYADRARIYDARAFENEILYQEYHKIFPDRKRGAALKRPLVFAAKSASIQPDAAAKNYNTQALRLKRLTVEKVWQGHV